MGDNVLGINCAVSTSLEDTVILNPTDVDDRIPYHDSKDNIVTADTLAPCIACHQHPWHWQVLVCHEVLALWKMIEEWFPILFYKTKQNSTLNRLEKL